MRTVSSFILLLLSLLVVAAHAQNVTISGTADAYKGREIGVYTYDDLVTCRPIEQSNTIVDESGRFELKMSTSIIQRVFLKTGNHKAHLYAAPGGSYEVIFPAPDTVKYHNPNTEQLVNLNWKFKDTLDINALIIHYNFFFQDYYNDHYAYFITSRGYEKIDSLRILAGIRYKHVNNDYFKNYIDYNIASLKASFSRNEKSLFKEYFAKRPVQYSNNEYMEFFNYAFKGYFQKQLLTGRGNQLLDAINNQNSYAALNDVLLKEEMLANDTLRQLVMLKGLYDAYTEPTFKRENIGDILSYITANSNISDFKKIAANINRTFVTLAVGQQAPLFELPDKNGNMVRLSDFKDKVVYINFFTTTCTTCLQEMKAFTSLKKEFGDKVVLISISLDDNIDDFKNFVAKNPRYNWNIVYAGTDSKVKEDYNLKSTSAFFLINSYGKLAMLPAPSPSQGIEESLKRLTKKETKPNKVGER